MRNIARNGVQTREGTTRIIVRVTVSLLLLPAMLLPGLFTSSYVIIIATGSCRETPENTMLLTRSTEVTERATLEYFSYAS